MDGTETILLLFSAPVCKANFLSGWSIPNGLARVRTSEIFLNKSPVVFCIMWENWCFCKLIGTRLVSSFTS